MSSSGLISAEAQRAVRFRDQLPGIVSAIRILVVGDLMLDRYWFGDVSRISPEAPVPVVRISDCDDRLGGAANVARNVVALGAHATLAGVIGQDEAAQRLRELLACQHIDSCLQAIPGMATTVKLRVMSRRQHMLRIDFDNAKTSPVPLRTDDMLPLLRSHDALVISDYGKGGIGDPQPWVVAARELGLRVLIDPKWADFSRYAGATVLKPNLPEFIRASGISAADEALDDKAHAMRESLNVDTLLVTRSDEGVSLFDRAGVHHFPAQVREVFDVCGAGDTVGAVMITLLAAGIDNVLAAWLANRAAGIAVSRVGTTAVTMSELLSSLPSHCR